ncbi:MAG: thiosulfohydrolase SoxB [Burkholderiales bacterium]|nr:thiosulfohydrolase SoxB [Burkholderiales bacterium]
MHLSRREFMQIMAVAAAQGLPLAAGSAFAAAGSGAFYDLGKSPANVTLMHITDCHAQLLPVHFREPDVNIGVGDARGRPPHLVGEALLKHYGLRPGTREAHAYTYLDYVEAARSHGKVGGFAHLAALVKQVRVQRPGALLLDGGDTWQGSATALWSKGQDMVDAAKLLGVDIMTGHWEFTYGAKRVEEVVNRDFKGHVEFLAQNIRTADFDDPVFRAWTLRKINGAPVAVIGQAFPYTPIANPRHLVADWTFGIQEERLQRAVDEARKKGAQAVVLLSHNGMDTDLKLASRVSGIDAILGGHTHDAVPQPVPVKNRGGTTLVTNAGSNGKFLGVLELDVRGGGVKSARYRLLPVFANLLAADADMTQLIRKHRAPYEARLGEKLAVSEGLLFRRGNFNGSFDQLILDALLAEKNAEIAFSPGFRWGTSILPGEPITTEDVMSMTAITYPYVTTSNITGGNLKNLLEDICDNLFNPDPYYQQGGDMVRVGGLQYACNPTQKIGSRISDMRLNGKAIEAGKSYKLASWAPVTEGASGEPVWDVVTRYLRSKKVIKPPVLNRPRVIGVDGNPGIAV